MKKFTLSLLGLVALAACSGYDYYETNVRYYQDGADCIYYYNENGERFSNDIRDLEDTKKIVYKNTICEHLYNRDTFGYAERNDRKAIVPVSVEEKAPVSTCGCNKCGKKQVLRNRYVIVTEM